MSPGERLIFIWCLQKINAGRGKQFKIVEEQLLLLYRTKIQKDDIA